MHEKPIRFTNHARERMVLRGASEDEVNAAIEVGEQRKAKRDKRQARLTFPFNAASPVNGKIYANKTVGAVFSEEENAIIILSVKVYYH
jgi:hypothetical protein